MAMPDETRFQQPADRPSSMSCFIALIGLAKILASILTQLVRFLRHVSPVANCSLLIRPSLASTRSNRRIEPSKTSFTSLMEGLQSGILNFLHSASISLTPFTSGLED